MRYLSLVIALLLAGCSFTTTIKDPDGKVWAIKSRNNALVHAKFINTGEFTVDNTGRPSAVEDIIKLYTIQQINKEAD